MPVTADEGSGCIGPESMAPVTVASALYKMLHASITVKTAQPPQRVEFSWETSVEKASWAVCLGGGNPSIGDSVGEDVSGRAGTVAALRS